MIAMHKKMSYSDRSTLKGVVVYLTRSNAGAVAQMMRSIRLLAKNFLPWSPADIIIFHEADFDRSLVDSKEVSSLLKGRGRHQFAEVDFSKMHCGLEDLLPWQRGYRHMCHFFANDIFLRPELSGYDYYMRLDVDSYILSKIKYNVFERMKERGWKYVYRLEMNERKGVSVGLLEAVQRFFSENPDLNIAHPCIRKVRLYYTNFEICDLSWFRADNWQRYFASDSNLSGIEH